MRLYLAVAVLMLAFVAYTEAQEADGLSAFGDKVVEFGKNVADTAKTHFETIKNSEFAQNTKDWFTTNFEKLKNQFAQN